MLIKLYKILKNREIKIILGHSRLVTNGQSDNQPVTFNNIAVIHNGIIVNHESLWRRIGKKPNLKIDTEIIPALFSYFQSANINLNEIPLKILEVCEGVISCAVVLVDIGKVCLFSNNNSLYIGNNNDITFFASERYPLLQIGVENVQPVLQPVFLDIPKSTQKINSISLNARNYCLIPSLSINHTEEKLLEHTELNLQDAPSVYFRKQCHSLTLIMMEFATIAGII